VADLYRRRWRIEEGFNTVKRLLGLSYLWTGSLNGIQLQIWGTWIFYAILVDLGDAVADRLSLPIDSISLAGLKQKLSPNKAQTGFISRKYVHIFLQPAHKSIRYSCSQSF
jgi:IS4 transposase